MSNLSPCVRRLVAAAVAVAAVAQSACGGAEARKARHLEKGQSYLAEGNLDKARVEFQNALQIAPTDSQARLEMGVVNEKLGKVREAAGFYQGSLDVNPDNEAARANLARLYLFSGAADRAMELVATGLEKHPDDAELLALRAGVHVRQKDVAAAQADAERAVRVDPRNADAIGALAGIYAFQQANDKAQALLEDAIKRLPDDTDLRIALSQVYTAEKRPADVERVLLDLVRLRPAEKAHRIRLAQFYLAQAQVDAAEGALRDGIKALPAERELKLSLIDLLAARRSPAAAEQELKRMIAAAPGDTELQFALGRFYVRNGQEPQAETVLQQIIATEKLDAAGLAARDRLAELKLQRGDSPGAEALIGEVLAKSPRDDDALFMRGNIALSRKDPKAAVADLRSVLRDQPNAVGVLRALSRAHLANGEPAIAEETLRRAVDANPKDAALRLDLAQLLAQIGKPDVAKPLLLDLVKDRPDDVVALESLFRVAVSGKDYGAARTAADALVAARPEAATGYLYEGMLAEEAKQPVEALRSYRRATDLQPDALEPLQAEVRLLVSEKRVPDALKRLDEVAARAPASPLAPYLKGDLLLLAQGRNAEAQEAYRRAIALAPKWWLPYRGLARAQWAAQSPDAAVATLTDAQKTVDQPAELALELAQHWEQSGRVDEAIRQYGEALDHDAKLDVAANNLAMLLVTHRKDAASLARAKALVARFAETRNPAFLDTYGWVLYANGESAASVPVLERAVSQLPNEPVVRYHLGMAQSRAGSTLEARENLSRAVKSGAKFAGLDEARATLDRLSANAAPKS